MAIRVGMAGVIGVIFYEKMAVNYVLISIIAFLFILEIIIDKKFSKVETLYATLKAIITYAVVPIIGIIIYGTDSSEYHILGRFFSFGVVPAAAVFGTIKSRSWHQVTPEHQSDK
jgi:hypothetical protein